MSGRASLLRSNIAKVRVVNLPPQKIFCCFPVDQNGVFSDVNATRFVPNWHFLSMRCFSDVTYVHIEVLLLLVALLVLVDLATNRKIRWEIILDLFSSYKTWNLVLSGSPYASKLWYIVNCPTKLPASEWKFRQSRIQKLEYMKTIMSIITNKRVDERSSYVFFLRSAPWWYPTKWRNEGLMGFMRSFLIVEICSDVWLSLLRENQFKDFLMLFENSVNYGEQLNNAAEGNFIRFRAVVPKYVV